MTRSGWTEGHEAPDVPAETASIASNSRVGTTVLLLIINSFFDQLRRWTPAAWLPTGSFTDVVTGRHLLAGTDIEASGPRRTIIEASLTAHAPDLRSSYTLDHTSTFRKTAVS